MNPASSPALLTGASAYSSARERPATNTALRFGAVAVGLALLAASLAGLVPLGFSIVTVFLFAGPHNFIEFRYFLSRMPAHWGPLRTFFLLAIGGAVTLTASFAAIPWLMHTLGWSDAAWSTVIAVWNTALVLWIATLIDLRGRQTPRRDWSWSYAAGFALISLAWLVPQTWDLALLYLHPLVALFFLDRELGRNRPHWRRAYRAALLSVPLLLAVLWWKLHDAAPLPGDDALSARITQHAGAGILSGVSSHFLVAAHTFLEMLHYSVWIIAIPLVGMKSAPWTISSVPLYRRSRHWRKAICAAVACGAVLVIALWGAFVADYPLTRDVYFTAAMLHVLAEVPFLLRTL
jgi:hypothetical protein